MAFIYNHEKDLVERSLINLATVRIEFNDEESTNGTRVKNNKSIEFRNIFVFFRVLEIHFPLLQILMVFLSNL